jgi:Fe-S cluster assembly protein SufD
VKLESWRFTNPAALTRTVFADAHALPASTTQSAAPALGDWPRREVLIVNGRVALSGTEPTDGVRVLNLASALAEPALASRVAATYGSIAAWQERAFVALNTALADDAAVIDVPEGALVEAPVRVTYGADRGGDSATALAVHPRVLVLAGRGARVTVIEDLRGAAGGDFVNSVIEFDLADEAQVEHVIVTDHAPAALATGAAFARLGAGARFASRSIALGGRLMRRDTVVTFDGPGGEATLDGLYVVTGEELVDHHTTADHAVPGCTSRELFKGVLDGSSRAVFNGAVIIRPGAQKSDAGQSNQNLLLSDDAMIDTKPELQIFADDVKCSHGATVGQLDDDALFYLRARGIGPAKARAMLTHAFAREVVERIVHPSLRADMDALVERRMEHLAAGGTA